ncbi:MAG: Abi family protein [Oscillospiraceae bacterium]|mgnify:FL=1|nr:Abi family protein [Oscillospiraceae bacterium]
MNLKKPATFDEQICILEKHGISINNCNHAKDILKFVNYYRLTGYALQFRVSENESLYTGNISFDDVYNIYKADEHLRNLLRLYIEKAEIYYRTQIAYGFAISKCTVPPYDQHYNENNFYDKDGYNHVMVNFGREKDYYKDSLIVKHHKDKYSGKMPIWVMVELMSFSGLSKLYKSMYISEKSEIAKAIGVNYTTLENHLHCLSVLRNKCAHGARLYNTEFYPPAKFTSEFLKRNPEIKNNSLFAYILILLKRLPDKQSKQELIESVQNLIEQYKNDIDIKLMGFPTNYISVFNNNL